ncbi:hypothetical protein DICPUDRAFT_98641 [Dictyostelium purpureum]|uniref:RING-type domain-containing protein n=1 Tax=Dictyostelium purpureum TaxID=5786 RepID=F0ZSA1_DICPU|nr:uncharacterized protein DICPUDRAFT_98641 [Dictyostelium purpureum]EGC33180.1 hypothetical protein DICPUDRAFT_98641 [Dictyostelium purpureum]|eukprot:XP_003290300.1 hypothetical protein DICPUDRAFT_98641 [Dictyostelium purpureum]
MQDEQFEFLECSICSEEIVEYGSPFSSQFKKGEKPCKHSFCSGCIKRLMEFSDEKKNKYLCPICREEFDGFIQCKTSNDLYTHARSLKREQKILEGENIKLNESLNQAKNENLNEIEDNRRRIQELEDFKNKHLKEIDIAKSKIKDLETEIQKKEQDRIRDLESNLLKFDGQQQQILSMTQNNRDLSEANQQYFSKNTELNNQINSLFAKLQESKQSIQNRDNQIEKIEFEKREILKKLEGIEQFTQHKFNEHNSILRSKDNEISGLVDNNRALKQKLVESQARCEDYRKNYEILKDDSSNGFKKNKDLEGIISSLRIELSRSQSVIDMLNQQKKAHEKSLEDAKLYQTSRGNSFAITTPAIINTTANKISNGLGYFIGSKQNFNDITKPYKSFKIEEKRGSNKNTQVFKVSTSSGNNFVIKLIPMNYPKSGSGYTAAISSLYNYYTSTITEEDLSAFREPMILYTLNHSNILKLESITRDDGGKYFSVLSPFVQNDLEYVLLSNQTNNNKISPTTLTFANMKYILYQLISAVYYLHSRDLVHRDIKPTSILLLNDNQLKLCSFGLAASTFSNSSSISFPNYPPSSYGYLSPEFICSVLMLEKEKLSFSSPSSSSDIDWKAFDMWSIGCIFLEMLFKNNLFKIDTSALNNTEAIMGSLQGLSLSKTTLSSILNNISKFKESSPKPNSSIIKDKPFLTNIIGKPEKDFQSLFKEYIKKNNINGSSIQENSLDEHTSMSNEAYSLLCSLLSFNPQTRIKSQHAVFHPFFSNEPYYIPESNSVLPNVLEDISSSLTDRNISGFIKEKCSNLIQI